jgi:hypothetical protein
MPDLHYATDWVGRMICDHLAIAILSKVKGRLLIIFDIYMSSCPPERRLHRVQRDQTATKLGRVRPDLALTRSPARF